MKGFMRNLVYWTKTYEQLAFSMIMGIMVYFLAMSCVGGNFSAEELRSLILGYIGLFLMISIFVNGFTTATSYFPMTVSLSSTRRASFVAMQIVQHVITAQYLLLGAVAYYYWQRELFYFMSDCVLTLIGVLLLLIAIANFTCVISVKCGKIAGVVTYIASLIAILSFMVGIIASSIVNENFAGDVVDKIREFVQKPYLFIGGLTLDAVILVIYYKVMKRSDIQL